MITWNLDENKKINYNKIKSWVGKEILIVYKDIGLLFRLKYVNLFQEKDIQEPIIELASVDKGENLHVIKIHFMDFLNVPRKPQPNSVYIANISKKDNLISGSGAINFAVKICEQVKGVKKIALFDGATKKCPSNLKDFDLSLYKLLTQNETFYSKFGFKLWFAEKKLQKNLEKYGSIISKFKVLNIIKELYLINILLKNNTIENIKFNNIAIFDKMIFVKQFGVEFIWNFIANNLMIIEILKSYSKYTFGKAIELLNKNACEQLSILFKNLEDENYYIGDIFIKNMKYELKFKTNYLKLLILRKNFSNQGFFVKEL
jgi:hypothetical protein